MKRKYCIFMLVILYCTCLNLHAQIVYSDGRINMNNATKTFCYPFAARNWQGMYLTCKDSNFFQLDLTAANPRLAGTGNQVVFFNTETSTFNNIQVGNVYNYSDSRAKENIQTIQPGLDAVSKLRPVSYNWKAEMIKIDSLNSYIPQGPNVNEKLQYGFLAQDMEQVLPDIVTNDESGFKMINYVALVPVLVKAVQELQEIVNAQTTMIEQLRNGTSALSNFNGCKIVNCQINNSTGNISVEVMLSGNTDNAYLTISSINGNIEKRIDMPSNCSYVTKKISGVDNGIHVVTLHVNNLPVDSKNLIMN